ncbi:MAG: DUF2178 domain-containing protein [Euryarchaeota archaeon]|nr:DUF2178 domain-containing protein [Euryarchaeota archaeon]
MSDNINNKRMFTIWRMAAYIIGISSVLAGLFIPDIPIGFIGIGIASIILFSARQRYRVVTYDERTLEIYRRATSATFRVFGIGLLAIYILNRYLHPVIGTMSGEAIGDGIAILLCLMMCCHIGFYVYYRWRM